MKRLFITLVILLSGLLLYAQDGILSMGYVRTTLEKNAVNLAVDYAKNLETKLGVFKDGSKSSYSFAPDIKILVGSNDVFNGITAKYVGNIMVFDTTTVGRVTGTPDLGKFYSNFPVSIGVETNQSISTLNGILEAGYVPWYRNIKTLSPILKRSKLGLFIQAGYKFKMNDSTVVTGGAADQSKEIPNENILRAKLVIDFSPVYFFDENKSTGISLIGNSTTWYDFLHNKVYYKLEGKLRFIIAKNYFVDFAYQKGSGAPNFNQGEQFTTNLAMRF